jgi:hypothetical protein
VDGLSSGEIDRYLIRDSQRIIEAIEALVRIPSNLAELEVIGGRSIDTAR